MKVFAVIAVLSFALTVQAGGDPCCNYTMGGDCITHCPGKRSLGFTSLAKRWVNRPANAQPYIGEVEGASVDVVVTDTE